MSLLATRFESHDGHRLRVARQGHGPPLVLLRGYPDNLQIFCELLPRLAAERDVIAFDWPGLGYSEASRGGTTPFHMADRLVRLLDAWGLARVCVLGSDMGGQPAFALAARHPDRVERLVVANSLVAPDEETSWEIRVLRWFRFNRLLLGRLPRLVFARAERTFLVPRVRLPRELREDLWSAFSRRELRTFLSRMCAGYEASLGTLASEYPSITRPTLVLWGKKDAHFPPNGRPSASTRRSRVHGSR